jgi:hypothetical protein
MAATSFGVDSDQAQESVQHSCCLLKHWHPVVLDVSQGQKLTFRQVLREFN